MLRTAAKTSSARSRPWPKTTPAPATCSCSTATTPISESPEELGFYGAEAAADQGYGWQYIYLFFRNQDEAKRFGVDQDFLDSIAGGVEELNGPEWEEDLEENGGSGGAIAKRLEGYEKLGRDLGIRVRQAAIVSGPNGTETLQDGPSLGQIERAIEAVQ